MRFNLLGLAMFLVSISAAMALLNVFGSDNKALGMIIGGPLLIALDVTYRKTQGIRWFGWRGGRIFIIPAWLMGVGWIVAGMVRLVRGH